MTVVAAPASARADLERRALLEAADAWLEYLDDTRDTIGPSYGEVEPWAWARLETRLDQIAARYERLLA